MTRPATGTQGTLSGATWSSAGKNGNGISFDGSNDWVTVNDANDLDLTTGMTIEAWVFPTTTNSVWRTVIAKDDGNNLAYAMQANSTAGRPYGLVTTGGEQLAQGPAALPVNTWSHLATTYDGAAVRLYVNGALVTTKTAAGSITTSGSPLHFGGNSGPRRVVPGPDGRHPRLQPRPVRHRAPDRHEHGRAGHARRASAPAAAGSGQDRQLDRADRHAARGRAHRRSCPNGRVAMWDGATAEPGSERIWDPNTGTFESIPSTRNLFCAAYVKLPDGRLAVFGGHTANYNGIKDVNIYDYQTKTWKRGADMARGRWYPSATMLSDGRVLVVSGDNLLRPAEPAERPAPAPVVHASRDLRPGGGQLDEPAERRARHAATTRRCSSCRTAGSSTPVRTPPRGRSTWTRRPWSDVGTSPITGHSGGDVPARARS